MIDGAPYQEVNDSGGTNIFSTLGSDRAGIVPGVPIRASGTSGGFPVYLNANAFAIPGAVAKNPIGRFGDAGVGRVVGRIHLFDMLRYDREKNKKCKTNCLSSIESTWRRFRWSEVASLFPICMNTRDRQSFHVLPKSAFLLGPLIDFINEEEC